MAEVKYTEIKVVRVSTATTKDGRKFPTFKTLIKDGNKEKCIDLSFVSTVKNLPTEPCIIKVENGKWNISKAGLYPKCWVKEIAEILPLPVKEEENPFI